MGNKRRFATILSIFLLAALYTRPSSASTAYYGGRVLQNAHIYLVYWGFGSLAAAQADPDVVSVNAFAPWLSGAPIFRVVSEYGSTGTLGYNANTVPNPIWTADKIYLDSNTMPTGRCITPTELEAQVKQASQYFGSPLDAIYVVMTSSARTWQVGTGCYPLPGCVNQSCGGYHYATTDPNGPNLPKLIYVDLPNSATLTQYLPSWTTLRLQHETAEAITDPVLNTGWVGEIGDPCFSGNADAFSVPLGSSAATFQAQALYSQISGACVKRRATREDIYWRDPQSKLARQQFYLPQQATPLVEVGGVQTLSTVTMYSDPAAVSWGESGSHGARQDVLWLQAGGVGISHAYSDDGANFTTNTWANALTQTNFLYRPAITSPVPWRLDVFAAVYAASQGGQGHYLVHDKWTLSGGTTSLQYWTPSSPSGNWQPGGGPGAVSWNFGATKRVDIYYLNTDSPPSMTQVYSNDGGNTMAGGGGGSGWMPAGRTLTGDVTAASMADNTLNVFVMDTAGTLWNLYFDGSGWSWNAMVGVWAPGAGAVGMGDWRETWAGRGSGSTNLYQQDYNYLYLSGPNYQSGPTPTGGVTISGFTF